MKTALFRFLAAALTLACVALVGTIEVLNSQAGDGFHRKARQEPHSEWRLWSLAAERKTTEAAFRRQHEIQADRPLNSEQAADVQKIAQLNWTKALPHERLARAMRNYSPWGAPLGILTLVLGIFLCDGSTLLRATCCGIGAITLLITLVRYIPSLGW